MNPASGALYLYALSSPSVRKHLAIDALPDLIGPIHADECQDFIAVFSSLADVSAWQDGVNTASVDWVTSRAIHHAQVIEHVWRRGPVYPARFGTLFTSRTALAQRLAPHRDLLNSFLAETSGQGEWDVKLFFDPNDIEARWISRELEKEALNLAELPAGRRYLAEQQMRREVSRNITQELVKHCQDLANHLISEDGGFRERALPPEQDHQRRPLAHWALLWPLSQGVQMQERLAKAIEAQAACGITLQWTGPWPPYSFRPILPGSEM